jgi:hypothetical protein
MARGIERRLEQARFDWPNNVTYYICSEDNGLMQDNFGLENEQVVRHERHCSAGFVGLSFKKGLVE